MIDRIFRHGGSKGESRERVTCGKIQVEATLPTRRKVLLLLRHTGSRSGSGSVGGEVEEGLILYLNTRLSADYMHFNYWPDAVALTLPRRPTIVKFLNYRHLGRGRRDPEFWRHSSAAIPPSLHPFAPLCSRRNLDRAKIVGTWLIGEQNGPITELSFVRFWMLEAFATSSRIFFWDDSSDLCSVSLLCMYEFLIIWKSKEERSIFWGKNRMTLIIRLVIFLMSHVGRFTCK